ncbi:sensor histidine kinase [Romboutsia weinsteinii]|nr:HAMP domain-containing sensor histidine kinase [Romboutsia weinsteinii]
MYLSFSIGLILCNIDYFTFIDGQYSTSNYIAISPSILRVLILFITIMPNSKVHKFIYNHKVHSIVFVILYSFIFGLLEYYVFDYREGYSISSLAIYYNLFLIISYLIISLRLMVVSMKKNLVFLAFFSTSIFLLAIKAIYSIYGLTFANFNSRITSIFITYLFLLIIIIAIGVELHISVLRSKHLNKELVKYFNFVDNNYYSYMFICDENLNISYINNKIRDHYNIGANTDINIFKRELLKNNDLTTNLTNIISDLKKFNSWRGILKSNETGNTLDCSFQVLGSNHRGSVEILVSYIDISEHIQLETEIEIQKLDSIMKDEFISNVSHELKTPLNMFSSTVQLLDRLNSSKKTSFNEVYARHSNSLNLNCKRMLRLVNNLVDTSRLDLGALRPDYGNYNIVQLIENIYTSISKLTSTKNIQVYFDSNVNEHYIKCDSSMIERALLNLISNSIKYSANNSNIYISLVVKDINTFISIKDEGFGIPYNIQDKIFDKFIRGDLSFTRLNEGCGIGLNLVKSIVNMHVGEITLKSVLGVGTTFEIQLPNVLDKKLPLSNYSYSSYNTELELSDIYEIVF